MDKDDGLDKTTRRRLKRQANAKKRGKVPQVQGPPKIRRTDGNIDNDPFSQEFVPRGYGRPPTADEQAAGEEWLRARYRNRAPPPTAEDAGLPMSRSASSGNNVRNIYYLDATIGALGICAFIAEGIFYLTNTYKRNSFGDAAGEVRELPLGENSSGHYVQEMFDRMEANTDLSRSVDGMRISLDSIMETDHSPAELSQVLTTTANNFDGLAQQYRENNDNVGAAALTTILVLGAYALGRFIYEKVMRPRVEPNA